MGRGAYRVPQANKRTAGRHPCLPVRTHFAAETPPCTVTSSPPPERPPLTQHASPIDPADLLEIVSDDPSALAEVVAIFCDSYPAQVAAMHAAVVTRDGHELRETAHSLKGGVSHFGAARAQAISLTLEQMGARSDFSSAPSALHDLEEELAHVQAALQALLPPPP